MLVDPSNSGAGARIAGTIRQASQATGASFNYLLATAQVESGLDPQAGASTSSARGLFQFIEQTWLATMKQSGAALGYARYAAAVTQTASGRYEVADPTLRSEILKLRNDPTANAVMAGAFTRTNAAELTQQLGRAPSEGELYIAHFLGSGGAARLIGIAASNPTANAAAFFAGAPAPILRSSMITPAAPPAASRKCATCSLAATTRPVPGKTRRSRRKLGVRPELPRRRTRRASPTHLRLLFPSARPATHRCSTVCLRMRALRRSRRS